MHDLLPLDGEELMVDPQAGAKVRGCASFVDGAPGWSLHRDRLLGRRRAGYL
jgi:hypothetical protein